MAGDGGRGSGLGLAIVQAVAQTHGGRVSLERPESGSGTRFVITLPTEERVPEPTATPNGGPMVDGQTSTTTGSTIGRRRNRS